MCLAGIIVMCACMGAQWFRSMLAIAIKTITWLPWNDGFESLIQGIITTILKASPAQIRKRRPRRERLSRIAMVFGILNLGTTTQAINPASEAFNAFPYEINKPYGNGTASCTTSQWKAMLTQAGIHLQYPPPFKSEKILTDYLNERKPPDPTPNTAQDDEFEDPLYMWRN